MQLVIATGRLKCIQRSPLDRSLTTPNSEDRFHGTAAVMTDPISDVD